MEIKMSEYSRAWNLSFDDWFGGDVFRDVFGDVRRGTCFKLDGDIYSMEVEVPGFDKSEVILSVEQRSLVIKAENSKRGAVSGSYFLPKDADQDSVSAELLNGILKVSISRVKKDLKKIEIK
jgi:HSP20 family molecular chaperone IbpA